MPEGPSIVILKDEARGLVGRRIVAVEGNTKIAKERLRRRAHRRAAQLGQAFPGRAADVLAADPLPDVRQLPDRRAQGRRAAPRPALRRGRRAQRLHLLGALHRRAARRDLRLARRRHVRPLGRGARRAGSCGRCPTRWPATRCSTRTSSPASATSSRTRSCSGSACIRWRRSAPCRRASCAQLVDEARRYSFDFLEWKKAYVLRKHWLAHTKRTCPRCAIPFVKAHLGRTQRRSFFCERCQRRYGA